MTKILVIPKQVYQRSDLPINQLVEDSAFWMDRDTAETDENFLQIIPYVLAVSIEHKKVFLYQRKKGGNEKRLHDNFSVGIGGHVDQPDTEPEGTLWDVVLDSAEREMKEEVIIGDDEDVELFDSDITIYDDTNEVGRVHLGVLFVASLEDRDVLVRETDKLEGGLISVSELHETYKDRLENWSKIAVDKIISVGSTISNE